MRDTSAGAAENYLLVQHTTVIFCVVLLQAYIKIENQKALSQHNTHSMLKKLPL